MENINIFGYGNIIKKLIVELPKQMVIDRFNKDPDKFNEFGVYNRRKTRKRKKHNIDIYVNALSKNVSKNKNKTNYYYEFEDARIGHWKDIINGTKWNIWRNRRIR